MRFDNTGSQTDNRLMNVSLPIPLEEFVRHKVAVGEFHSVDEGVSQALLLLQQQDSWKEDARRKIDVGWQQAKSGQLRTPEQVSISLAARKENWKSSHGR